MSRIGRMPVTIPAGVDVKVDAGNFVTVKGPKGTLSQQLHGDMVISVDSGVLTVTRPTEEKEHKALHGLTRALISNMVTGVTTGFRKELEINGVGYRAAKQGASVVFNLGYSHTITLSEEKGITLEVPTPNKVVVSGPDKQRVGQIAAIIREMRLPEPYLGKGIKYTDERIRRKTGKAGK
ncbi:MAG: 50S ribosomal protein L6 [Eubacteriales bacterium]